MNQDKVREERLAARGYDAEYINNLRVRWEYSSDSVSTVEDLEMKVKNVIERMARNVA